MSESVRVVCRHGHKTEVLAVFDRERDDRGDHAFVTLRPNRRIRPDGRIVWLPDRDDHGLSGDVVIPSIAPTVKRVVLDERGSVVADTTYDTRDDREWHWHYTIACRRSSCSQNLSVRAVRLHEALRRLMDEQDTPEVEAELTGLQGKVAEIGSPF